MKLLFEYTFDYIKRNRRSSIAIMFAILMTTTMLSALCGFFYNMYIDNLRYILEERGDWHGELFDITYGRDINIINNFDSIEAMMIKGNWKVAKIDDPRREYLVWRDANYDYWHSMPEGSVAILEGRIPEHIGEIALSKQYFEHHSELSIGDTIILPLGNRVNVDGSEIDAIEPKQTGETFISNEYIELTVVAKLDIATSSTVPAYTALGYFDNTDIQPDDKLTIYFRFNNIFDTYKELPKIAKALGYKPNEYGNYMLRYNTDYLSRKFVIPPNQISFVSMFMASQMPLTFIVVGLLVTALFVLIIHNAFALSISSRISQLGVLASIGATPRQIKRSVILEGFLLTIIPLPVGIFLGNISVKYLIDFISNNTNSEHFVLFEVGWQSLIPSILLTLLTVWWSAIIPARHVAKMSPITAIRQGEKTKLKKLSKWGIGSVFGIEGELAENALKARKKSYRTATISLALSFMTFTCLLCITSVAKTSESIYQYKQKNWENQDISVTLHLPTFEDYKDITQQIANVEGIENISWYKKIWAAVWLPDKLLSDEFQKAGGFEAASKKLLPAQLPLLRDEQRRVLTVMIALDDKTFNNYCKSLGIDSKQFYQNDKLCSIFYNKIEDITTSTKRNPVYLPYLDVKEGDVLNFTEKKWDDYEGDFAFDVEFVEITDKNLNLGNISFGRYSIVQYMNVDMVNQLSSSFTGNSDSVNGIVLVKSGADISAVRAKIEQICESYLGSGDYILYDENEYLLNIENSNFVINIIFGFISGLLAIIGLSNSWATVLGSLAARRREFAILRSVGLSPKKMHRILMIEAVLLGLKPIIISIPFIIAIQFVFLRINEVTFVEWLPFIPLLQILIYITAIFFVTVTAFFVGSRELHNQNIIEAIKLDLT